MKNTKSSAKKKITFTKKKVVIKKSTKQTTESTQSRTIKGAISHGRKQTNKQFRKFAGVVVIIGVIQAVMSGLSQYTGIQMGFGADAGYRPIDFIGSIIGMRIGLGFTDIAVHTTHNQSWKIKNLFPNIHVLGKYILAYILMGLSILIGFVLLIIPGIYITYRLSLMQYYIVDQNSSSIQALKQSRHTTKGNVWKLIGLSLLFVLINILGLLALGIGLFRTIPTTVIAYSYVYERLK